MHPKHPYTRLLLACHPDRAKALAGIPGAVPSPLSAAARLPLPSRAVRERTPGMRRRPAAARRASATATTWPASSTAQGRAA